MNWTDLRLRLRALLFQNKVERELDDELQFHLEMEALKTGAVREARVRFGGIDQVKEECRDRRGTQWIDTTIRDIKYALRGFRRNPLFVLNVVGVIALGLGLNSALFTLFNTFVLRPLSVPDPYSLYQINWSSRSGSGRSFSWRDYERLRDTNPAFSETIAMKNVFTRMNGHPLIGQLVTGNYFHILNAQARIGRTFVPDDAAAPGRDPVMVLSYATWQSKFISDPDIVGKKVELRGRPFQIVGVTQEDFRGFESAPPECWIPLTMAHQLEDGADLFGSENPESLKVIGRLRHGWSESQAKAALTTWLKQVTADRTEPDRALGAILQSKATAIPLSPQIIRAFTPLIVAFGLVLVLACANVANMMLARAMARQREVGIRLSLGASRAGLIRQLLTESVLLAIPAGAAGFLVSRITIEAGLRIVFATLPPDMAELIPNIALPPDFRVLGFTLFAALVSALLFGLAPALQSTRADLARAARGEFPSDVRPMRLRNALVICQITVSVLLLICSGVLIRGARTIRSLDVGFRTRGGLFLDVSDQSRAKVLARLASTPAVEGIAAAANPPLSGILPGLTISTGVGQPAVNAWHNQVSPAFFTQLEIPIVDGRNFTEDEAKAGAPVAIVSELTAQSLWPKGAAVGRELRIKIDARSDPRAAALRYSVVRVVGVTRNIISCSIPYGSDPPVVYLPTTTAGGNSLLLRVRGDVESVLRALVLDLDETFPAALEQAHTFDQAFALSVWPFQVASWVGSALGGLALLLTLSGIYGVLSYLISQRTKEIGIRMALGATARAVTRLVLKQSGRLALIGIAIGTALALGVSRLFASHLVLINTFDLLAYSSAIFLVAAAALAAAYFPSRRAARINPLTTLRYD